jgi:glucose/arabinose dehydrogenase
MLVCQGLNRLLVLGLLTTVLGGPSALAAPTDDQAPLAQDASEELVPVPIDGPFEFPWSIGFLPDGSILVTEKPGRLQLVKPGSKTRTIKGLPAVRRGEQGGLLDVAVDPDFIQNGMIYLSYTFGTETSSTVRVLKGRLDLKKRTLINQVVLFESDPPASANEQLGGRLAVTPDGYLFLSLGDRWEPGRAQDLSDHAGSIIRIRTDGLVPRTNPLYRCLAQSLKSGPMVIETRRVWRVTVRPGRWKASIWRRPSLNNLEVRTAPETTL